MIITHNLQPYVIPHLKEFLGDRFLSPITNTETPKTVVVDCDAVYINADEPGTDVCRMALIHPSKPMSQFPLMNDCYHSIIFTKKRR